ncbi:flavodoxin [Exiguobacterium aurantiacum]|uniref:Flavodoxin n=1 Tax=Exiguobacterium aurantiacum TaxID=33987 RepID=A0ABY5FLX2_9BACL|nr:flavodoxin [Exiguobacterium aurantiacum]UTT42605.1 flavodoxin [Exiguobacterium aurantiacum]
MKILIGYVSMSGNTEDIAHLLQHTIQEAGHVVSTSDDLESLSIDTLLEYDGILLGAYTWGDGDLPYEAEGFVDDLEQAQLRSLACAAFGSGDTDYPKYCAAVDTIEQALVTAGGEVLVPALKIEFDPNTEEKRMSCITFASIFVKQIEKRKKVQLEG